MALTRKKILIHAVGANTGGGLRHLSSLVSALSEADKAREYEILIRESLPFDCDHKNIQITHIPDWKSSNWLSRMYFDLIKIPRLTKSRGYSCVISLMNFGPVFLSKPHIIYQCNLLYYSDVGLALSSTKTKIEIIARRFLAAMSMQRSIKIITPSDSTRVAIQNKFPKIPADRFATILHGFDSRLYDQPLSNKLREKIEAGNGHRLIYPANLLKHKAFDILIDIAYELRKKVRFTLFLTIESGESPRLYKELVSKINAKKLNENIVILGSIPHSQMGAAYQLFDLMIYPSLLESFGMPLIEAMAYNCPIVASDTEINRETCGDAALFYSPYNPEDAAEKIALALQSETRQKLINLEKRRLAERDWSWRSNANALLQIIDDVEC